MTNRDRRALALGVVVITTALILRILPLASRALQQLRHDVAERGVLVQRMRSDVREVGALTDSAALVRRRFVALAPRILTGGTEAEAIANLTSRLGVILAAHDATFGRADAITDSTRVGWLRRVTVRLVFESDLSGVLASLNATAHEPAVLAVSSVHLNASDPTSADPAPEIIAAEATVSGWFLVRKEDR